MSLVIVRCKKCLRRFRLTEEEAASYVCACIGEVKLKTPVDNCVHRENNQLRLVPCTTCTGNSQIKVFPCEIHGECTIPFASNDIKSCSDCKEYEAIKPGFFNPPRPEITVRNLIYHVCPLKSNTIWKQNIRQLTKRFDTFNGRRIIAIATGGSNLEKPSTVHKDFGCYDCEFIEIPNDPELREVVSFLPLLIKVQNVNSNEATFYAHTKGNSSGGGITPTMYWRNEMYHNLLDRFDECQNHLRTHAFVGTHKMVWNRSHTPPYPTKLKHGTWMMAGTFFWFRHDAVFTNKWRNIAIDRYGAESWPSGLFPHEAAKSMFQPWPELQYPSPSPYNTTIYKEPIEDDPLEEDSELDIPEDAWESLMNPTGVKSRTILDIPSTTIIRPGVSGPKTVVVYGLFRGGTSFVAEACVELGIPMGDNYVDVWPNKNYISYEDELFAKEIDNLNWEKIKEGIVRRDSEYEMWGFKKPSIVFVLDKLLPLLRNPHLIVVVRDPLSAWQSGDAHGGTITWKSSRTHAASVFESIDKPRAPLLAISYERAKGSPDQMKKAISQFLEI